MKFNYNFIGDREELQLRATGTEFKPAFRLKPSKRGGLCLKNWSQPPIILLQKVQLIPPLNLAHNIDFNPVRKILRSSELKDSHWEKSRSATY
ncbi:unnamed protein product [Blepharisma stoltei]|uniref:Uncharacterized protein n=1 Tax=Blepharisma stoltei TaxID=1481888 RepID=A0AAU9KET0_9CILI|nr:unnamed protein product [Blepharisma stoltei]